MHQIENNLQKNEFAATAYQSTYVNNMSGFEIVSELYKGMITIIQQAQGAYQRHRLDEMCTLNQKVFKILVALQSHLDFERGGEASDFLNRLYNHVFASLSRVLKSDDPSSEFDRLVHILMPISKQWEKFINPNVQDAQMDGSSV